MRKILPLTRTVYSLVYPETQRVIDGLLEESLSEGMPFSLTARPWEKKQDDAHHEFLQMWRDHVKPVFNPAAYNREDIFDNGYYTNGSSEAIRESITLAFAKGAKCIHLFEGEYEGYEAYAQGLGMLVIKHPREDYERSISEWVKENNAFWVPQYFYVSQPSSIDGDLWKGYHDFAWWLYEYPSFNVMLDLCYVGCTCHNNYEIKPTNNLHTVFFSLSKVFGVYYYRIGGCFSREEIPNLEGNKWFKNMFSLQLGKVLLGSFGLSELPHEHKMRQVNAVRDYNDANDERMFTSDVVMLFRNTTSHPTEFTRNQTSGLYYNRYCVTPEIQTRFDEAKQ